MGKYVFPVLALVFGISMALCSGILYEWFMATVAPGLPDYLRDEQHDMKANVLFPFILLYGVVTFGLIVAGGGFIIFKPHRIPRNPSDGGIAIDDRATMRHNQR